MFGKKCPAVLKDRGNERTMPKLSDPKLADDILEEMGVCYLPADGDYKENFQKVGCHGWLQSPDTGAPLHSTPVLRPKINFLLDQSHILLAQDVVPDGFKDLSDEIMLNIFKWLPQPSLCMCAQVCRRWRRLSYDESLWKRLDLGGRGISATILFQILRRGLVILRLAFAQIKDDLGSLLSPEPAMESCRLQYLDLTNTVISPQVLGKMLASCRHLVKLSLEGGVMNEAVCRAVSNNPRLNTLNLCMCDGLTAQGIARILLQCKELQSLNVAWTHLQQLEIRALINRLPRTLQQLNLQGCKDGLMDTDVALLVEHCPLLVELDLSDATQITAAAIEHMLASLRKLRGLSLSRCYNLGPLHPSIFSHGPSLRYLELFGIISDSSLRRIRNSLSGMEVNCRLFSTIARPTTGVRRTSLWGLRSREQ